MQKRIWFAAGLTLAVVGCGGSGGSSTTPIPGTGVTGNISCPAIDGAASQSVIAPAGQPTPISVTANGTAETDLVPGGMSVTNGQPVLLISATLPIYLTKGANGNAEIYLLISGARVDTGLRALNGQIVTADGTAYPHYVFPYPPTGQIQNFTLTFQGPVQVGPGPVFLTVTSAVTLGFQLSNGGTLGSGQQATYPTGALYALPANGTSLYESFLNINLGRVNSINSLPTTMTLLWPGTEKVQTRYTQGGETVIWAADDHINDAIPGSGISSANLVIESTP